MENAIVMDINDFVHRGYAEHFGNSVSNIHKVNRLTNTKILHDNTGDVEAIYDILSKFDLNRSIIQQLGEMVDKDSDCCLYLGITESFLTGMTNYLFRYVCLSRKDGDVKPTYIDDFLYDAAELYSVKDKSPQNNIVVTAMDSFLKEYVEVNLKYKDVCLKKSL